MVVANTDVVFIVSDSITAICALFALTSFATIVSVDSTILACKTSVCTLLMSADPDSIVIALMMSVDTSDIFNPPSGFPSMDATFVPDGSNILIVFKDVIFRSSTNILPNGDVLEPMVGLFSTVILPIIFIFSITILDTALTSEPMVVANISVDWMFCDVIFVD